MSPRSMSDLDPHTAHLIPRVGRLCGFLSAAARRRVAEIAVAMREAALNDGACQVAHLRAAGFSNAEIGLAWPLARAVLEAEAAPAGRPPALPLFTADDVAGLRRFNARFFAAERATTLRAA